MGKPYNSKEFWNKYAKWSKQDSQNQLILPMHEGGEP